MIADHPYYAHAHTMRSQLFRLSHEHPEYLKAYALSQAVVDEFELISRQAKEPKNNNPKPSQPKRQVTASL